MSDHKRTSYSFQHRGELPSHDAAFTRDAGKAKQTFETEHNAQPKPKDPQPDPSGRDAWHVKVNLHELPQPHPDFAPPNRARFNADWEENLLRAREAFLQSRSLGKPDRSRIRKR